MTTQQRSYLSLSFIFQLLIIILSYKNYLSLEPIINISHIEGEQNYEKPLKKINNIIWLNKGKKIKNLHLLNSFLEKSELRSIGESHKKKAKNSSKEKNYEIDFKKSYCILYNYSSAPFLNKSQNVSYDCYLINANGKKIMGVEKFLSNYTFSCSMKNDDLNKNDNSKIKISYAYKLVKKLTHSCTFKVKEYGKYTIHAFLSKKGSKVKREINSKLNTFYYIPSKLYLNNSNIFDTYQKKWININSNKIQYIHNKSRLITAIDLMTSESVLISTYGRLPPNLNLSNIEVSLFSFHDINYKFADLEARIWKYKNKEYIGIFIKDNKNGENFVINSSFDYKIKIIFLGLVKILTFEMKLNIKNYKTCFHDLDIKKTKINFGNNISLIKGRETKLGNIELRTEDNNLYNYDIGIKNIQFILYPPNKHIIFRIISEAIKGIYTVYANSTHDYTGDIKLYIKNKKYKRKLYYQNINITFEIPELFELINETVYRDTYNYTYEFIGELINNNIDFNFYLYNKYNNTLIKDQNILKNTIEVLFEERDNSSYHIIPINNKGLFRFKFWGFNISKTYKIIFKNKENDNQDINYEIIYNSSRNHSNADISNINSFYSIINNESNIKPWDLVNIKVTLKDKNNIPVEEYSQTLKRYQSFISVNAKSYSDNFVYKFDYDEKNKDYLLYKYDFFHEGLYFINVTFEDNYIYPINYLIKIPKSAYTYSYNRIKIDYEGKMFETSEIKLNNTKAVPKFLILTYNSSDGEIPYEACDDVKFSCELYDKNKSFSLILKEKKINGKLYFVFNNTEDEFIYHNLPEGIYPLNISDNNSYNLTYLNLTGPNCYFNCSECNLSFIYTVTNQCSSFCPPIYSSNNLCKKYSENIIIRENISNNIRDDLINGRFDERIKEEVYKQHKDIFINQDNIIYQITSSFNQINNEYKNVSSINLGEYEDIIRELYNMNNTNEIIILKIEHYEEGLLIPIIEYEIFNKDYYPINLDFLGDKKIELKIPVLINEKELFKHDPNSKFYNDKCYPYTTEDGTDIPLYDRKKEFNNNNLNLCQKNCELKGYDAETKKAICSCNQKFSFKSIKDISFDKKKFLYKFKDIKHSTNLYVIKCFSLVFTKKGFISNIGGHFLFFILILLILLLIIFKKTEYIKIISLVRKIAIEKKRNVENERKNEGVKLEINNNILETKKGENANTNQKIKEENNNIFTNNDDGTQKKKIVIKKKIKKSKRIIKGNDDNQENPVSSHRNLGGGEDITNTLKEKKLDIKLNENNILYPKNKDIIVYNKMNNLNQDSNIKDLNDKESNILNYKNALNIDKRNYIEYYISLLRTKHILLFTFYTSNDYNSFMVKIILFFFVFSLFYIVNALFFTDSTMHKIYEDKGDFKLIYQIPMAIYSFIITMVLNLVVKYFSLTENDIIKFKNEEFDENKTAKVEKCINLKFILFFSLNFFFIILFWYYISCFGAVFMNTQIPLIKDTLISFTFSLSHPLVFNLIPGIFRIHSLKNNNNEFMYKISLYIQLI